MRMSLLLRAAACFGLVILSAGGCEVGDPAIPGGDGDDGIGDGDGDGTTDGLPGPDAQDLPDPSLAIAVDKPSISTELMSENMVTLSLQGADGFEGAVGVTATVVDTAGAPLTDWQVALSDSTVTLTPNGSEVVVATLTIPSNAAALSGRIKFDVTSPLVSPLTAQTDVTALNQVTIGMKLNAAGDECVFPAGAASTTVRQGAKIRWANIDTVQNHLITIHVDGNGTGLRHQPDGGTAPGAAYEQIADGDGSGNWYCHAPSGGSQNHTITIQ